MQLDSDEREMLRVVMDGVAVMQKDVFRLMALCLLLGATMGSVVTALVLR